MRAKPRNAGSNCSRVTGTAQAIIFTVIFLEFLGYLLVRQLVNVIEYFSACEWKQMALTLGMN